MPTRIVRISEGRFRSLVKFVKLRRRQLIWMPRFAYLYLPVGDTISFFFAHLKRKLGRIPIPLY